MSSHPSHCPVMCSGMRSRADGSGTEIPRDATPEQCAWHITGWSSEPEEEMPWRENSCDREKRWRGCPERVLRASWRKRRSDDFIDAISLSLFFNIHCIWSRASDLFRATALLARFISPTKRGVGGKAPAIGFLGLPEQRLAAGPGLRFHLSLVCCRFWLSSSLLAVKYEITTT